MINAQQIIDEVTVELEKKYSFKESDMDPEILRRLKCSE